MRKKYFSGSMLFIYVLAFIIATFGAKYVVQLAGWGHGQSLVLIENEVSGYLYTPNANIKDGALDSFSFKNNRDANSDMYYEIVNDKYNEVVYKSPIIPYEQTDTGGKLLAIPEDNETAMTLKVYAIDATTHKELSQSDVNLKLTKEVSK